MNTILKIIIKLFRWGLFPFSLIYGSITYLRNKCYDWGFLKSTSFPIPVIAIGNLSTGGTGKTPHTDSIAQLLKNEFNTAILSRGYGRKTNGYVLATKNSNAKQIGDEPLQLYKNNTPKVTVAVCEKRVLGIEQLIQNENVNLIILDDAFQHRALKAGFYVLLTTFEDPFFNDFVLPTGNLREFQLGKKRANAIIVTKCPKNISPKIQKEYIRKIKPSKNQEVYFTTISYASQFKSKKNLLDLKELKNHEVLLITGIANPKPLLNHLNKNQITYKYLDFPDHHDFSDKDIANIHKKLKSRNTILITTEKDYMRLNLHFPNAYYLPISVKFIDKSIYKQLKNYVRKH